MLLWPVQKLCTLTCDMLVWPVHSLCTLTCDMLLWPVQKLCTLTCDMLVWPVQKLCTLTCDMLLWPVQKLCTLTCDTLVWPVQLSLESHRYTGTRCTPRRAGHKASDHSWPSAACYNKRRPAGTASAQGEAGVLMMSGNEQ